LWNTVFSFRGSQSATLWNTAFHNAPVRVPGCENTLFQKRLGSWSRHNDSVTTLARGARAVPP